jgi:putative tryptophan/tyrosine transport system substrate-binding protein
MRGDHAAQHACATSLAAAPRTSLCSAPRSKSGATRGYRIGGGGKWRVAAAQPACTIMRTLPATRNACGRRDPEPRTRMRRRDFVAILGGAALWPVAAPAQQKMPVVGFLHSGSPQVNSGIVEAFRQGLRETGYTEDKNIKIEFLWGEDRNDRLPALAAELIGRPAAVIAANSVSAIAAKAATATIPIVFQSGVDPVASGLVASLGHPGGNTTGVSFFASTLEVKKLEVMHELIPLAAVIAVLVNPNNPQAATQASEMQAAGKMLRRPLVVLEAGSEGDIDAAVATLAQQGVKAVVVVGDPFFNSRRKQLIALAARYRIPAIYSNRENVDEGGLISYGASLPEAYRQVGIYVGRILKGAKPADLPVLQPTKFEMVINLKAAKALGLELPAALLDRADKVIE